MRKNSIGLFSGFFWLSLSLYLFSLQGPFYAFDNLDPAYAYLLNGYQLLHFHAPDHIDHPGTPLQILISLIILIQWGLQAIYQLFTNSPITSLEASVLTQPENYLITTSIIIQIINAILIGLVCQKIISTTQRLNHVLLFQASLLMFPPLLYALPKVTSEPLLLSAFLLSCLAILPLCRGSAISPKLFGLSLGFGLACKLTYLPIGFILLMFNKQDKKLAIKYTLITFLVATLPIVGHYLGIIKWAIKLATHSGLYGTGEIGLPNVIEWQDHFVQLSSILPNLVVSFLLYSVLFFYICFYRQFSEHSQFSQCIQDAKKFIVCNLLAISFGLFITLKHPGIHYLLPVMILCALTNLVLMQTYRKATLVLWGCVFVGCASSLLTVKNWRIHKIQEAQAQATLEDYSLKHDCKLIGYFNPSLIAYSLYFGDMWSGKHLKNTLSTYYPDSIFFDTGASRFYSFGNKTIPENTLADRLLRHECLILQGSSNIDNRLTIGSLGLQKQTVDNGITISGQYYQVIPKNSDLPYATKT